MWITMSVHNFKGLKGCCTNARECKRAQMLELGCGLKTVEKISAFRDNSELPKHQQRSERERSFPCGL